MKRVLTLLTGTVVIAAATVLPMNAPAAADSPALGSSYAAAATVTPGSGLDPQTAVGGEVGDLFGFLQPVLDQVVTPLQTGLAALPGDLVSGLAAGLSGDGNSATSPDSPLTPPTRGYPDCTADGWSDGACYGPSAPSSSDAPLLSMTSGRLQGYATVTAAGSYAKAHTGDLDLSGLGIDFGDLGVVRSSSTCTAATRQCSGTGSVTGLSLLGGAVTAHTGTGATLLVGLNGGAAAPVTSYGTPVPLDADGVEATAQADSSGNLALTFGLTLDQLLDAVGVPDGLGPLGASDAGSTITLTMTISAGATPTDDGVSSWGLEVGLGLTADISISVLGAVTVEVTAGDDSGTDLADLQLAYTTASNGADDPSSEAPPNID